MATRASYQIERLGPSINTDSQLLSKPAAAPRGGGVKSRWPAVKKVLWNSSSKQGLATPKYNLKLPSYCVSHIPVHSTFSDEQSLAPLLAEVEKKESALEKQLDETVITPVSKVITFEVSVDEEEARDTFEESLPKPKRPPEDYRSYQDFVCMFLSLFLQSKFSKNIRGISQENDPNDLIQNLASKRSCPNTFLFRRVAIDPNLLAAVSPDQDNPGYAENGVAINQLARLLDVAVLQFLSTVNEHTEVYSILWALDYMKNLLSSLINSMNSLNSFGWYGAPHIRIRKGTNLGRRSISYHLQPPVFNNVPLPPVVVTTGTPPVSPGASPERIIPPPAQGPLVVVAAAAPTAEVRNQVTVERDPVTGQRSPVLSSSALPPSLQTRRQVKSDRARPPDVVAESDTVASGGGGRQRRNSRQELQGCLKPELAISPPLSPRSSSHSPSPSPSSPRSPRHATTASEQPQQRKRKVTPVSLAGALLPHSTSPVPMGSIREEEGAEDDIDTGGVAHVASPIPGSYTGSMESIQEEEEGAGGIFPMDTIDSPTHQSNRPSSSPLLRTLSPPGSFDKSSPLLIQNLNPPRGAQSTSPTTSPPSHSEKDDSSLPGFGSPRVSPEFTPSPSPQPSLPPSQENLLRSGSLSPPPPQAPPKRGVKTGSLSPPPVPSDVPEVDIDQELETLLNGEGRVSLIALLHAIAKFPHCNEIWTHEVAERCFSLIQLCMDIGMPPQKDDPRPSSTERPASSGQERRQRFFKQDNKAFNKLQTSDPPEKQWKRHSKFIVEFSINALIQCSTCSIIGCSTDVAFCRLKQLHISHSSSIQSRLIHNMRRIHLHSPAILRQALIKFAQPSVSSCFRIFRFLHVVLQYCVHNNGEVRLLSSIAMALLSVTVDRIMELDIKEPSIQETIVREACDFFSYANHLFCDDTLPKTDGFQHLHMYIHRIALSVILPARSPTSTQQETITSPVQALLNDAAKRNRKRRAAVGTEDIGAFARPSLSEASKPKSSKTLASLKSQGSAGSGSPLLSRHRSSSFTSSGLSSSAPVESPLSKAAKGSGKSFKSPLLKQQTVADIGHRRREFSSKTESVSSEASEVSGSGLSRDTGGVANGDEWRGLRLDVLRKRIQRLVVLMNLSEPGTVPSAEVLASLVDLCDGTTVVARSMVFLECSMFVHNLCSQTLNPPCTIWVQHHSDSPQMHNVAANLRKWAEAISEKLRLAELRDKGMYERLQAKSKDKPVILPEEPVFPEQYDKGTTDSTTPNFSAPDDDLSISYALKMAACNLLLEITRFLRDIPAHFVPAVPLSHLGTPLTQQRSMSMDRSRKESNVSLASDAESAFHSLHRKVSAEFSMPVPPTVPQFGSSLSVEDADPTLHSSMDEHSFTGPRKKRASFYLHINSPTTTGGSLTRHTSFRKQARFVRVPETPTDVRPPSRTTYTSTSPSTMRRRRKSVSYAVPRARRPSIVVTTNAPFPSATTQTGQSGHTFGGGGTSHLRRKSLGVLSSTNSFPESELPPPTTPTPHSPFPGGKASGGGSGGGAGTSIATSLNVGLTKLKRTAQRAFSRHGHKPSRSVSEVSPNSSPGLSRRRKSHLPAPDTYSQRSASYYPSLSEESWRYYPWLDVIEHLVLLDTKEATARNKQSCLELAIALKRVYSRSYQEEPTTGAESTERTNGKARKDSNWRVLRKQSSLGTIFIHRLTLHDAALETVTEPRPSGVFYSRVQSLPNRPSSVKRTGAQQSPRSVSVQWFSGGGGSTSNINISSKATAMSKLSFSTVSSNRFLSSFLASHGAADVSDEMIHQVIESESPFERGYLLAQSDKERCQYVDFNFSGLMHIPFSTLVHAAPILHTHTFSTLRGVAWDTLLSPEHELSEAAAAFFLLACAKESEKTIKGFVASKILSQGDLEQRGAILRFKVLWDSRYGVWPRMEERAQKKLNLNDWEDKKENEQTIGYSLLANLLGHPGEDIPLSPCEPVSVCASKTCGSNPDKCYRPTKLAPVVHTDEISEKVHGYSVSGVSLTQETGIKSNSVVYYGFESEDATGPREWEAVDPTLFPNTLLPLIRFLLKSLIPSSPSSSSSSSSSSQPLEDPRLSLDKSELAREVVWACMVEDPRLFFRPLFNRFNRLYMVIRDKKSKQSTVEYLMASCLEPFHIVLQAFSKLPPRAAHIMLNNFVGVVLRHTDQPYSFSGKIIQSVLTLIAMVAPSVQGLDSKLLKSFLKKESCYTTIMSTARIRGVDRVFLLSDLAEPRRYKISGDMTFGQLIAEACETEQLSLELLNNWYLVDRNKGLPVLSSLVVQDHYSVPADNQHPTFVLHNVKAGPTENIWGHQMDQLFVFKMCEIARVLFTTRLLQTGPEVEKGFTYSDFAVPNYSFIHNELVELNSFPRKALTSLFYEAGPSALQHFQLRSSDVMLKGMWVRFVLELLASASPEYDWANTMLLFINVVNGALLLHSEDQTILYYCLVTLLIAVTKFNAIFKKDGYQMIIPTLVQVYSLHIKDKLITRAIKFVWTKFYQLNQNVFFLQVTAAASTLLSEEAALLSNSVGSKLPEESRRTAHMEAEEVKRLNAKAMFELNDTLRLEMRVEDELNILHCCHQYLDPETYHTLIDDTRQPLTVKDMAILCITLASWNPEAIRGMQVLVCLDHLIPLVLSSLGVSGLKFVTEAMQYLVKGCESLSKVQKAHKDKARKEELKNSNATTGGGGGTAAGTTEGGGDKKERRTESFAENELLQSAKEPQARKTSVAAKVVGRILYNPNRKETQKAGESGASAILVDANKPSSGETRPTLARSKSTSKYPQTPSAGANQFRFLRNHHDHRVLQLSTDSLLSIVSEFCLFYSRGGVAGSVAAARKCSTQVHARKISVMCAPVGGAAEEMMTSKVALDPSTVSVLVTTAMHMMGSHYEAILQGKGLNSFFAHMIPNLDWTDAHLPAFSILLQKLYRFFRYLQKNSNKAIFLFDNLTNFISGLTLCIHHNPHLVQGQDQNLTRLKMLLEVIMVMQSGRGDPHTATFHKRYPRGGIHRPLLEIAPAGFAEAVVLLAVELIVVTNSGTDKTLGKFRYHISDLVTLKALKESEEFLMPKIILPLIIQLGLRSDMNRLCEEDINFMMKFVESKVELFFRFSHQKRLPEQIFRVIRVLSCSFSEMLVLYHWNRIAQWVISLFNKKLTLPDFSKKTSVTSITTTDGSRPERTRANRLSSVSGSNVSPLESFISFHKNLLHFFESFLMVYRVPLFSLLLPLLWKMEPVLQMAKQSVMVDNPAQLEKVTSCIERCQRLQRFGSRPRCMKGQQQVLRDIQDDLRWLVQVSAGRTTLNRSHTTVEPNRRNKKKAGKYRRNSVITLTKIKEEGGAQDFHLASASLPRGMIVSTKKDGRPKKLGIRSASTSEVTSPPQLHLSPPSSLSRKGFLGKTGLGPVPSPKRKKPHSPKRVAATDSPESPPITSALKKNRTPKLAEVRNHNVLSESVEYPADVEDLNSPEGFIANSQTNSPALGGSTSRLQVSQPDSSGNVSPLVIGNSVAKSPLASQAKKKVVSFDTSSTLPARQSLVSVEVHHNPDSLLEADASDLSPQLLRAYDMDNHSPKSPTTTPWSRDFSNHSPKLSRSPKIPRSPKPPRSPRSPRSPLGLSHGHSTMEDSLDTSLGEMETSSTRLLPLLDGRSNAEHRRRVRGRSRSPSFPTTNIGAKKALSQPNVYGDESDHDQLLGHLAGSGSGGGEASYVAYKSDDNEDCADGNREPAVTALSLYRGLRRPSS